MVGTSQNCVDRLSVVPLGPRWLRPGRLSTLAPAQGACRAASGRRRQSMRIPRAAALEGSFVGRPGIRPPRPHSFCLFFSVCLSSESSRADPSPSLGPASREHAGSRSHFLLCPRFHTAVLAWPVSTSLAGMGSLVWVQGASAVFREYGSHWGRVSAGIPSGGRSCSGL